jgi:hypothetical protein
MARGYRGQHQGRLPNNRVWLNCCHEADDRLRTGREGARVVAKGAWSEV